jgi:uncharacterized repeat protein (TIGR01451 family)
MSTLASGQAVLALQETPTGSLEIYLQADDGGLVGGACYDLFDAQGAYQQVCDDDGDGIVLVGDLPAGYVSVSQVSGPDGYYASATGEVTVPDGGSEQLYLGAQEIPQPPTAEPTDEPTVEPTLEPTDEPTVEPTDEPTDDPTLEPTVEPSTTATATATETLVPTEPSDFAAAADPGVTIDCTYDPNTNLSTFHVLVAKINPTDPDTDPNLVVTVSPHDNNLNPVPDIVYNDYDSGTRFNNQPWRDITVTVFYPGNPIPYGAEAACRSELNDPTIVTSAHDENDQPIPDGGSVPVGTSLYDTATFEDATITAVGTATYSLYNNADCSGTPIFSEDVTVADGLIPNSPLTPPMDTPGLYNWQVTYTGDDLNNAAASVCGTESVIVGQLTPTVTTVMKNAANDATIPQGSTIPVDTAVYDTVILEGASENAGGTVHYALFTGPDCSGAPIALSSQPVTNGTAGPSDDAVLTTPGTYNWLVTYTGDDVNEGVASACGSETLTVAPLTPTLTTTMTDADTGTVVPDGGTVLVESRIRDAVTIAGATSDASGTATFNLYTNADCTGTPVFTDTQAVSGGVATPSAAYQLPATGVYNWQVMYSGDARNAAATSVCGSETFTAGKRSPSLTTVMRNWSTNAVIPDGSLLPLGTGIYDTSTLTGGTATPAGTVTYNLYRNYNCSGTPLIADGPHDLESGSLPNSFPVVLNDPGTYNWQAVYSGDAANNGATSVCGTEEFFIGTGSGAVITTPEFTNGQDIADDAQVAYDTPIRDTAVLRGVTPTAGGSVTFYVFAGTECGDPSSAVFTSAPVSVVNGVLASPSQPYNFPTQGVYNWQARYTGDANNDPASSPCGSETLNVGGKFTNVTTGMFATGGGVIADNAGVLVGTSVYDTATVTGANPDAGGTITFNLYKNANCSGTPFYTSGALPITSIGTLPASGDVVLDEPVVYNWRVSYSGDANNRASQSNCGAETMNGRVQPTITTQTQDGGGGVIDDDAIIDLDTVVRDTAQLAGNSASAGGTVTFNLYENADCSGTAIFSSTQSVGNGVVTPSATVTAQFIGTYNWQAVYSGDTHNLPATSECGTETFSVAGDLTITTTMRTGSQVIADDGTIPVNTAVTDQATLRGTTRTAGGTITYNLYVGDDCSGPPVHTNTKNVVNSVPERSDPYTIAELGTFNWQVVYSGDAANNPIISECGSETLTTTSGTNRNIGITCTYFSSDATSTFTVTIAKLSPGAPDTDPALTVRLTPLLLDLSTGAPIVYNDYTRIFERQEWRRVQVSVTWPDGLRGTASAGCNTTPLAPTLTTTMVDGSGATIPVNGQVAPGTQIGDTATLTGATVSAGGSVTYQLFANDTCEGTPLAQQTLPVTNGIIPPTSLTTVNDGGLYNWVVTYSGDRYNLTTTSPCGTERFFVGTNTIDLTTQVQLENGTTVADDGSVPVNTSVRDTTTLGGATESAGGTVTYRLFANADCSGTPVVTEQVTVANGVVPPSALVALDTVGTYNWLVTYSGDGENPPATSACGDETVIAAQATPSITTLLSEEEVSVGDSVNDTAVLTGATSDAVGMVTYVVFNNADCTGDPVYTLGPVTVANGVVPNSPAQVFDIAGDYQWQAHYSGDAKNAAGTSECGTEPLSVLAPTLSIVKTADDPGPINPGETLDFTITVINAGPGTARGVNLTDTLPTNGGLVWTLDSANSSADCAIESGTLTCDPRDLATDESIVAHITSPTTVDSCDEITNQAEYVSTNGGEDTSEPVTVMVECIPIDVVTVVQLEDGTAVPDDGSVTVNTSMRDTATLDGAHETATGTVTYELFANADCSGDPIATEEVTVANGVVPPSSLEVLDSVGTYNWVVTYSGDSVNVPAASGCGDETVIAIQATPSITTLLSSEEVSVGDEVHDTAVLAGATADAGGTVTYVVFNNADCSGDPVYTLGPVDVTDGVVPNSPAQVFDTAGDYQWQARYSGDAKNAAATSECGTEPLTVLAPALSIIKTSDTEAMVYAGETIGFTVTVTNAGPGVARGVTLNDVLPVGEGLAWTLDTENSSVDCAIVGADLECAPRDLEPEATLTVHITSPTTLATCGTVSNIASYDSENTDGGESETVTVTIECMIDYPVYKITCDTDPGAILPEDIASGNLPEGCEAGAGITFDVAENGGVPAGYTTDDTGMFIAESMIGSNVTITETGVPEDYAPVENPQTIENVQPGEDGVVFVNVLLRGSSDILKFICPSDTAEAPFFEISTQRPGEGRPTAGCISGPDVSFTISGDRLSAPVTIVTDANGLAHLDLPVGDYTIVEDATGASAQFTVEPNLTVAIRVFNADPTFAGTVTLTKEWCELPQNQTTITVGDVEPLEGCVPGDAELVIDGGPVFHVGEDGVEEFAIAPGSHTIEEPCAEMSASFDVPAGATVNIVIRNDPNSPTCGQGGVEPGNPTPTPTSDPNDPGDPGDPEEPRPHTPVPSGPVTSLPDTGSGVGSSPASSAGILALLAAAMTALGTSGIARNRRIRRS